jgi:putative FmdB family regulatory protein
MPFYEYECPHCGYDEEVLQKINDKPLTKCPNCGKQGLRKLMSAPVFRLKGSGWYETDFKPKAESKAETKTETAKADSAKAESAEAEKPKPVERAGANASKPAAKRAKAKSKPARKARR